MDKKMKLTLSIFGVVLILAVTAFVLRSDKINPSANQKKMNPPQKVEVADTSIISDKKIDAEINKTLTEASGEENFDSELEDLEIFATEETDLEEINNLINDDEL